MMVYCSSFAQVKIENVQPYKYSYPNNLTLFKNNILFSAYDVNGYEPWISDGTNIGTKILRNLDNKSRSSNPNRFTKLGNNAVFLSYQDVSNYYRLWQTDGNFTGTQPLKNIHDSGQNVSLFLTFKTQDSLVSFIANTDSFDIQLWVSDGTEIGTKPITKIVNGASAVFIGKINDYYYFTYTHEDYGAEVFKTRGMYDIPQLVKDIYPGTTSSLPEYIAKIDNKIVIKAEDSYYGKELWVTDGTTNGTKLLKDIVLGAGYPYLSHFKVLNNQLHFVVKDDNDWSIWTTDLTNTGTKQLLKAIDCYSISNYTKFQNTIYAVALNAQLGSELFKQTNDSLVFFRDFNFGFNSSNIKNFTIVNDTLLFFTANNSSNRPDIWVISQSNKNPQIQLRMPFSGDINEMLYLNNNLIFSFNNFITGENMLYKLDNNLLGLNSLSSNHHSIYPNPASESIHINNLQSIKNITIYNQLGQVVLEKDFEEINILELDIHDFNIGIYLVKIEDLNGGIVFEKLIKH